MGTDREGESHRLQPPKKKESKRSATSAGGDLYGVSKD
jgi:hypothetical protein